MSNIQTYQPSKCDWFNTNNVQCPGSFSVFRMRFVSNGFRKDKYHDNEKDIQNKQKIETISVDIKQKKMSEKNKPNFSFNDKFPDDDFEEAR